LLATVSGDNPRDFVFSLAKRLMKDEVLQIFNMEGKGREVVRMHGMDSMKKRGIMLSPLYKLIHREFHFSSSLSLLAR
jgi:hypothetical protein